MKNKLILTTVLLLSCAITGLYAAAPGGAGAAAAESLSEEAMRNLEDKWLLHSLMPDALAQQLARDWLRAGRNPAPSIEEVARYFEGEGRMFTRAILEKVRRKLLQSSPSSQIAIPDEISYQGDYEGFKNAIIDYLNYELVKIGLDHGVALKLSGINLGELVFLNPGQCIDLMHAIHEVIDRHLCILTKLDLSSNDFTTLPEGVFGQFDSLKELNVGENQLVTLPAGIFAGLTELEQLWLSYNQLATLPPGIFANLTHLKGLWLSGNQLAALPNGIFADLTNLWYIWLDNNKFATLRSGMFAGLTNIQELSLGSNQLVTLPPDIFAEPRNLEAIGLSNNKLVTLPAGIFTGLTKLKHISLFGNQLPPEAQEAIQRELPVTVEIIF